MPVCWCVYHITVCTIHSQLVSIQFQPASRMHQTEQLLGQMQDAMQPTDISVCGGYVTTYGFMADYYGCQFRDEVSWVSDMLL